MPVWLVWQGYNHVCMEDFGYLAKPCGDGPFTHATTLHRTCQDAVILNFVEHSQSATFIKALTEPHGQGMYCIDVSKVDLHTVLFCTLCHEIVAISIQAVNFFPGVGMWLFHLN